jgi:TatD DNase family protein
MFDSHCHLHDRRVPDAEAQIARARAAGVTGFLLAGVDPSGWADERAIASGHPDILMAFGVHPQVVAEVDDADPLVAQLSAEGAAAIGEIGLDGMDERRPTLPRQERAFRAQLAFARDRRLPVVLHILRAHARALEILRADGVSDGGVLHSCSASADQVAEYLRLGLHISFAGTVCNPNAKKVHQAALAVPAERLLVETDAPFQTPLPHRPAANEPAFLVAIVDALAMIRGITPALLGQQTNTNARRLFRT